MSIDEEGFLSRDIDAIRIKIRQAHSDYFNLFDRLNRFCHQKKLTFKVGSNNGQELFAVGLFLKLIADVEGAIIFLERGMTTQARSMLRIGLECLIRLANICTVDDFVRAYALLGEHQRLKYIRTIRSHTALRQEVTADMVAELSEKLGNSQPAKIETWARNVDMSLAYDQIYRMFSNEVHSMPRSLDHYLLTDESDEPVNLDIGLDPDRDIRADLLEASRLLIVSLDRVAKVFHVDIVNQLAPLSDEYYRLGKFVLNKGPDSALSDS